MNVFASPKYRPCFLLSRRRIREKEKKKRRTCAVVPAKNSCIWPVALALKASTILNHENRAICQKDDNIPRSARPFLSLSLSLLSLPLFLAHIFHKSSLSRSRARQRERLIHASFCSTAKFKIRGRKSDWDLSIRLFFCSSNDDLDGIEKKKKENKNKK